MMRDRKLSHMTSFMGSVDAMDKQISAKLLTDMNEGKLEAEDAVHIHRAIHRVASRHVNAAGNSSSGAAGATSGGVGAFQKSLGPQELQMVSEVLDPVRKPRAYRYFHNEFVLMQAVAGYHNVMAGTLGGTTVGSAGVMSNDVINMLFLSPLKAGTGNYTLAGRVKKHFEGGGISFTTRSTSSFQCASEFEDFLKNNQIHIILALHCFHAGQWLRYVNPRKIPYAMIFGGTDLNEYNKVPENLRLMSDVVNQASELILFCEPMMKKALQLWPRLNQQKVTEIPQAVLTTPASRNVLEQVKEKYKIDAKCKIFTLVAGIRPVKDPLYLIQTFSEWHQLQNTEVHLLIIGHVLDPVYAETFYQVVDGCPGVLYLGGMSTYETHALIRDSFAVVNTSISEGMCTALLESMELGVPVIARGIAGNRAIIRDRETGILFSDSQEFIEGATYLIENPQHRQRIVNAAVQQIKDKHNCDIEKEAYLGVFQRLNKLRPSHKEIQQMEEEEMMFEGLTASTASVDLAAVAAANSVMVEKKSGRGVMRRKPSRSVLNARKNSEINAELLGRKMSNGDLVGKNGVSWGKKGVDGLSPRSDGTTSSESSIQSDGSLSNRRNSDNGGGGRRRQSGEGKDTLKKKQNSTNPEAINGRAKKNTKPKGGTKKR